jgi:hypothetical protein
MAPAASGKVQHPAATPDQRQEAPHPARRVFVVC